MPPDSAWNDARLDDMYRRLVKVEDVTTDVAVLKNDVGQMRRSLGRVEAGVADLSTKLGQVVDEPLVRARDFRKQVLQGGIIALVSGGCVFAATVLAGLVH
jgi:hypothetical protein